MNRKELFFFLFLFASFCFFDISIHGQNGIFEQLEFVDCEATSFLGGFHFPILVPVVFADRNERLSLELGKGQSSLIVNFDISCDQ